MSESVIKNYHLLGLPKPFERWTKNIVLRLFFFVMTSIHVFNYSDANVLFLSIPIKAIVSIYIWHVSPAYVYINICFFFHIFIYVFSSCQQRKRTRQMHLIMCVKENRRQCDYISSVKIRIDERRNMYKICIITINTYVTSDIFECDMRVGILHAE